MTGLEWLYARQNIGIKLGLDKVHRLLAAIGDPQTKFQSVHIAGTNGKGSVARLIAGALQRAGHSTGLFTSPHLIRFNERIIVSGLEISDEEIERGLAVIQPAVRALDAEDTQPTFFEITCALAFWWFAQQDCDWAVIETGMGGRLDATNVLLPALTVITNISSDHTQYLGQDLADITFEKAGIMKPGVPLVTGVSGEPLAALKAVSHQGIPMSIVGEDYHVLPEINGIRLLTPSGEAHYDLALAGEHQCQNAAVAIAACDALRTNGVELPLVAMQQALAETVVPGRLEHIQWGDTSVLLDGAHNEAAAQALRYHLGRIDLSGFALVVGFSDDKPWQDMLDQWMPLAARVYAVPLRNGRSVPPAQIATRAKQAGFLAQACTDAPSALEAAKAHGHILVAGSLFLVGDARAHLTGQSLGVAGAQ